MWNWLNCKQEDKLTFDELRQARPELGIAIYAYTPSEQLTLEIHAEEGVFSFTAPTLQAAIDQAFPPAIPQLDGVFG
jgi:hypothetical protein